MATESIRALGDVAAPVERRQAPRLEAKSASVVKAPEPITMPEPDTQAIQAAVSQLNDYVQMVQRDLRFSVDGTTGRTIVTVLDAETDEIIRQIPPEAALSLVRLLQGDDQTREKLSGLLLRVSA